MDEYVRTLPGESNRGRLADAARSAGYQKRFCPAGPCVIIVRTAAGRKRGGRPKRSVRFAHPRPVRFLAYACVLLRMVETGVGRKSRRKD
jgi:hypothetical protein